MSGLKDWMKSECRDDEDRGPKVISLDLHSDPSDQSRWAVSFIYDDKGPDSHDGDIIFDGSEEEARVHFEEHKDWVAKEQPSYFDVLNIFEGEK